MNWLEEIGQEIPSDDFIETLNVRNEEDDWKKERLGMVTGSQLGKLVKKDGTKGYKLSTGKVATDLLYKIAWERFLKFDSNGLNRLSVSSKSMDHGNDYELEAIKTYEEVAGNKVELGGYKFEKHNNFFGGTPDGKIDKDLIIEVKCPWNGGNHLKSLIEKVIYNDEHFYQIQGYLLITGAKECDYVTYDPDLPEGINISIIRIQRDENVIEAIKSIIDECAKIINELIEQVKQKL